MESTSDAVNDPASVAEDPASVAAGFDPEHLPAEFFENPYPTYRWLRERDPVHRCPDGSFFLTRYADLDTVYRDRTHFSSDKKRAFGPKFGLGTPLYEHHTTSLVFNDDPYHARVRRQIASALTPNALKAMAPAVTALIERLGDALAEKGRFDLIEDFSAAIPVEVIGNLLGARAAGFLARLVARHPGGAGPRAHHGAARARSAGGHGISRLHQGARR
jgi:cytochrome P450